MTTDAIPTVVGKLFVDLKMIAQLLTTGLEPTVLDWLLVICIFAVRYHSLQAFGLWQRVAHQKRQDTVAQPLPYSLRSSSASEAAMRCVGVTGVDPLAMRWRSLYVACFDCAGWKVHPSSGENGQFAEHGKRLSSVNSQPLERPVDPIEVSANAPRFEKQRTSWPGGQRTEAAMLGKRWSDPTASRVSVGDTAEPVEWDAIRPAIPIAFTPPAGLTPLWSLWADLFTPPR